MKASLHDVPGDSAKIAPKRPKPITGPRAGKGPMKRKPAEGLKEGPLQQQLHRHGNLAAAIASDESGGSVGEGPDDLSSGTLAEEGESGMLAAGEIWAGVDTASGVEREKRSPSLDPPQGDPQISNSKEAQVSGGPNRVAHLQDAECECPL